MKRYKKHFTKFVQGRFFDELEVEGFLRERRQNASDGELAHKTSYAH